MPAAAISSAIGRAAANRTTRMRRFQRAGDRPGSRPPPSRLVTPWRRSQRGTGRKSMPPKMAMSAGPRVIDTAIAVRTVSARPGPNALSIFVLATTREAAAAATIMPAARMIGANSAVARRAARIRGTPPATWARMPSRKNTV